ncbi:type II secretion system secretin GspD [Caulobacter endophyticus]|uniref:Type II secretion system protein GspD n=1 Tax=Caulobacter endophyticus TaxID=2172652 RepID=A0A2T9KDX2_9CAUL|nr:type II secretion system secretin GspD [Caulobacter endophyticus]PVM94182.1 type II secretion system protein GspD [Caulobacter endophyticus]
MSKSLVARLTACTVLAAAGLGAVSPMHTAQAAPRASAQSFTFAFRDADVAQVAEAILGQGLGLTYTVDPAVNAKVSFRIDRRLTPAQLLEAFEAALAASDIALLREGDSLVLAPRERLRGSAALREPGSPGAVAPRRGGGYDIVATSLSFAAPTEVGKALEAMTGAKPVLYADDKSGLLVLGGSGSELQAALETIKVLDRNMLEGARIRWFDLRNATSAAVAGELDKIFVSAGVEGVGLTPLKRLNGLIVSARTENALDEVARWVARLDTPSRDLSTQIYVYHPRSASAASLARTLSQVLSSGGENAPSSDGLGRSSGSPQADTAAGSSSRADKSTPSASTSDGGDAAAQTNLEDGVRIGVDRESNSLIIRAPAYRWMSLQQTLSEIDRPPKQVQIQASIVEVSLTDDFRFGVDWSAISSNGDVIGRSIYNTGGTIGPSYPGFSVTILGGNIDAAVNALGSRTAIDVVSTPNIITLDNHVARLQIGDQVPIVTQTATSTATDNPALVSTVNYKDTGVILEVTPRISGDDKVVVEISQEVSAVARTVTSGIDSPTIQQRKLESTLVLQDGAVVALGGLISRTRTNSNSGVPGLKDVKGLGALFRSRSRDDARTELVVLLTARIVGDPSTADRVTSDLLSDMKELQARGLLR